MMPFFIFVVHIWIKQKLVNLPKSGKLIIQKLGTQKSRALHLQSLVLATLPILSVYFAWAKYLIQISKLVYSLPACYVLTSYLDCFIHYAATDLSRAGLSTGIHYACFLVVGILWLDSFTTPGLTYWSRAGLSTGIHYACFLVVAIAMCILRLLQCCYASTYWPYSFYMYSQLTCHLRSRYTYVGVS